MKTISVNPVSGPVDFKTLSGNSICSFVKSSPLSNAKADHVDGAVVVVDPKVKGVVARAFLTFAALDTLLVFAAFATFGAIGVLAADFFVDLTAGLGCFFCF